MDVVLFINLGNDDISLIRLHYLAGCHYCIESRDCPLEDEDISDSHKQKDPGFQQQKKLSN